LIYLKCSKGVTMNADVTYRHLTLSDSRDTISGFALWYNDPEPAKVFFDLVLGYFEEKKEGKNIRIQFDRDGSTYNLFLEIPLKDRCLLTTVRGIDPLYIANLSKTFNNYHYIPIFAGYTDAEGLDHFIEECYYNCSQLWVDGELIVGMTSKKYPVHLIKDLVSKSEHG